MTTRPPNPTAVNHSMRNKEENAPYLQANRHAPSPAPSPSPVLANQRGRSFLPSLVKSPEKANEFWTDSFLGNDASQTSLIPSPLPPASNIALSKPRKKIRTGRPGHDLPSRSRHHPTQAELPAVSPEAIKKAMPNPLARATSPMRSTGLSTPPRSREGSFVGSPSDVLSSPPPALTDTYIRIDQEEDLAHTEGDISDPESEQALNEQPDSASGLGPVKQRSSESIAYMPHSRGSTPTSHMRIASAVVRDGTAAAAAAPPSVFSDPTGPSFVDGLTDQNLKNVLTPHMQERLADKEALRKAWTSKKPIAFGKAGNVLLETDQVADAVSLSPHIQPNRVVAFGKAGRIKLASDHLQRSTHQRTYSDVTDKLDRGQDKDNIAFHNDHWHNDDLPRQAMPHNPRIHRQPYFAKNYGFPERELSKANANFELYNANRATEPLPKARSESPFTGHSSMPRAASALAEKATVDYGRRDTPKMPTSKSRAMSAEENPTGDTRPISETSSDIWADPDRPIKSVERDHLQHAQSRASDTLAFQSSPEKSRRFDLDFTGQSLQVSESPPVRNKNTVQDSLRDREIRGLAQQAVTTNRLSQLRARESQEKLRLQSRSPLSEVSDQWQGEAVLDSPAIIHRTYSNGSIRSASTPIIRPSPGRSRSHEILQRLARGSSHTPRSSTPSDKTINGAVVASGSESRAGIEATADVNAMKALGRGDPAGGRRKSPDLIKATPKVVGAWTDTILPDTVKTSKKQSQQSRYAQTPHVGAGGWIETPAPAPVGQATKLEPVQEATQEIPEELMQGIVKDSASDNRSLPKEISVVTDMVAAPHSLAREVLDKAKEKLENHEALGETADDSLNLGNTTIRSLQDLLDMDETQISNLGQSDTEVLDRLVNKLGRLQNNMQETRKGLSKLEHQISQPIPENSSQPSAAEQPPVGPSPLAVLKSSLPALYYRKTGSWLLRPTAFGWGFLAFWTWYLLENILAEIYSHPLYAERYSWPAQPEPEFPLVLPTMVYRWSKLDFFYPWIVQPLQRLFLGLIRIIAMWTGINDGFTDGPASAMTAARADTGQAVSVGDYGLDFDEYL